MVCPAAVRLKEKFGCSNRRACLWFPGHPTTSSRRPRCVCVRCGQQAAWMRSVRGARTQRGALSWAGPPATMLLLLGNTHLNLLSDAIVYVASKSTYSVATVRRTRSTLECVYKFNFLCSQEHRPKRILKWGLPKTFNPGMIYSAPCQSKDWGFFVHRTFPTNHRRWKLVLKPEWTTDSSHSGSCGIPNDLKMLFWYFSTEICFRQEHRQTLSSS